MGIGVRELADRICWVGLKLKGEGVIEEGWRRGGWVDGCHDLVDLTVD